MSIRKTHRILPGLAAVLALGLAAPATAQDAEQSGQSGNGEAQAKSADDVSDEQLEQFAAAYGQIRSVRAEYAPKIRNAENKEQRAKLKKQGRQEMTSAIRDSGLEISEYQQIGRALNGNKQLQARLQKLMQERGGSGGGSSSGQ